MYFAKVGPRPRNLAPIPTFGRAASKPRDSMPGLSPTLEQEGIYQLNCLRIPSKGSYRLGTIGCVPWTGLHRLDCIGTASTCRSYKQARIVAASKSGSIIFKQKCSQQAGISEFQHHHSSVTARCPHYYLAQIIYVKKKAVNRLLHQQTIPHVVTLPRSHAKPDQGFSPTQPSNIPAISLSLSKFFKTQNTPLGPLPPPLF